MLKMNFSFQKHYIWLKVRVLVTQSCPTLCNPIDCSPPGSSIHGILQVRILEWISIPSSRGSSQTRDQTLVSCITGTLLTIWATYMLDYNESSIYKFTQTLYTECKPSKLNSKWVRVPKVRFVTIINTLQWHQKQRRVYPSDMIVPPPRASSTAKDTGQLAYMVVQLMKIHELIRYVVLYFLHTSSLDFNTFVECLTVF